MTRRIVRRLVLGMAGAIAVIAMANASQAATCAEVTQLVGQGISIGDVAAALEVPVAAVQSCFQPRAMVVPGPRVMHDPAGPPPLGAAGPPPLGAAGPPPLGAAGPPPLGAPGKAPLGAPGKAPLGAAGW
jgi:hypothetical protein